jgi:hypothetical protein
MSWYKELPAELLARAERKSWFAHKDASLVLDWIEREGRGLLGMDTARKEPDGLWTLLLVPMLSTVLNRPDSDDSSSGREAALEQGRRFLRENDKVDLMFEPVW